MTEASVVIAAGLFLISVAVSGCASPPGCVFEIFSEEPPYPRTAVPVPEGFNERHPVLGGLLSRPDLGDGVGGMVDCKEGLASMNSLEEADADVRVTGEISRDTYVEVDGRTYLVNLGVTVRD